MIFLTTYGCCRSGLQCWSLVTNSFHARTAGRVVVAMTTLLRPPRSSNGVKSIKCKKRVQELLLSVLRTEGMGGKVMGAKSSRCDMRVQELVMAVQSDGGSGGGIRTMITTIGRGEAARPTMATTALGGTGEPCRLEASSGCDCHVLARAAVWPTRVQQAERDHVAEEEVPGSSLDGPAELFRRGL